VMRAEQLYPFPEEDLRGFVNEFPNATEVVWCQEEPQNQGAWYAIRHHLQACISEQHDLKYAGRPHSASPAVGYYTVHIEEQQELVSEAILPRKDS
jgi:2-oxoglutarate dehydrogenase E1 component